MKKYMLFNEKGLGYTIEAATTEEKKKKLEETLSDIQMAYADSLYREHNPEKKKFSSFLENINGQCLAPIQRAVETRFGSSAPAKDFELAMLPFLQEIDHIYESQPTGQEGEDFKIIKDRLRPIKDYIATISEELKKMYPEESARQEAADEERIKSTEHAGIFTYGAGEVEKYDDNTRKLLAEKGFTSYDTILDVHLPEMFATNQKFTKETLISSLEKLADVIIDEHPEIAAVCGHSWLFASPAYKRIAPFEILGKDAFPNWNQLIDQDGNIHKERFNEFIKTGELPYPSMFAYMKADDFIKKFSKHRGDIELKEVNPQWLKEVAPIEEAAKAEGTIFEKEWANKKITSEEDLEALLEKMPSSRQRLQRAGVYEEFKVLLKENIGLSVREIGEKEATRLKALREKLAKSVEENKYIPKHITL